MSRRRATAALDRLIADTARVPYVALEDARLHYQEHGQGDPLLLLHSFCGAGEVWDPILPSFVGRYRVIVPDLRGHGRSTGAPETIHYDRFAADVVALLDHLGIDRAHCVGQSAGGMCLVWLGTRHLARIRTLVLSGTTYTYDEHARAQMRRVADGWGTQPEWIDAQRQRHGATHGDDYWRVLRDKFRAFADDTDELPFRPADLAAITCPVLVLHGDRDPGFPVYIATTMYAAMPNAELAILPAVGHGPPRERPDLVVRILTDFLTRHADA
jgi:pimeloyl-ACP methyl ester carboxylesterase